MREFRVNLPRPRTLEDHALIDLAAEILAVLRGAAELSALEVGR